MTTLEKPPIGAPCNGCGLCCQTTVCSAGSLILGLVNRPGDRAPGPCPALLAGDEGEYTCGLMRTPSRYIRTQRGTTVMRKAVGVLIGAGAGCDEAGNEPDETALPKLRELQQRYLQQHPKSEIDAAWRTILG